MFTIEKFKIECANVSTETELREKIEVCARYSGYDVREKGCSLYDFFPWGYKSDYIGRFFVELKNGNSLLTENATIAEVETREVKFYANYADSGSDDYVYTFEIV